MKKHRLSTRKQVFWGSFILLMVLLFSGLTIFGNALAPYCSAREKAETLAYSYADLKQINHFSIFAHKVSYYSIEAIDKENHTKLVLIPTNSGDIRIFDSSDGISADQAEEAVKASGVQHIQKTRFGLLEETPVWEIYADNQYYYVTFEDGDLVS